LSSPILTAKKLIILDNIDMLYQLDLRQQYLCRLCNLWQPKVHSIPSDSELLQSWGPTGEELMNEMDFEINGSFDVDEVGSDGADWAGGLAEGMDGSEMGDESNSDDCDEEYGELLEACETFGLADEYHSVASAWDPLTYISTPSTSPQKRRRHESG
jgi:hypothetical protein